MRPADHRPDLAEAAGGVGVVSGCVAVEDGRPDIGDFDEVERRDRGVVEKCTFCVQRIDRGLEQGLVPGIDPAATPACVEICPVGARIFGDVLDAESPVSRALQENQTFRLREDWGTSPKVHYINYANGRS